MKDITTLVRGRDADAVQRLKDDIQAGRLAVPDDAVLTDDEYVEGGFLLKGGERPMD